MFDAHRDARERNITMDGAKPVMRARSHIGVGSRLTAARSFYGGGLRSSGRLIDCLMQRGQR
jgi:hypothetical protein